MLENEDPALRQKAVSKIHQIRANPPKPVRARIGKGTKKQVNPTLKWGSRDWWNTIDWDTERVDEPKILHKVTSEELDEILHKPVCFPAFPCHSQGVERAVKLVSTSSKKVCGQDSRYSFYFSCL